MVHALPEMIIERLRCEMPKAKTCRSAAKRYNVTGGSKVKRGTAGHRHILTKKNRSRKRNLRKGAYVDSANIKSVRGVLPHGA